MTVEIQDKEIWRVRLDLTLRSQLVQLPPDSRIISVQRRLDEDTDQLDLWAEVHPRVPKQIMFYTVVMVATGERVPVAMRYVSTVQIVGGRDVLHAYVLK